MILHDFGGQAAHRAAGRGHWRKISPQGFSASSARSISTIWPLSRRTRAISFWRLLVRARDEGLLASRDDPEVLAELINSYICGTVHKVMLERLPQEVPGPDDLLGGVRESAAVVATVDRNSRQR